MKILVVGGLGFVGSAICHHLSESYDLDLVIFDNESKGTLENIAGIDCQYLPVDITDKETVQKTIKYVNPDIVVHLAAMHFIPECNQNPTKCLLTNVIGTEIVLQACKQVTSLRKVIVTSSQAVYPIKDTPNKEDDTPFPCDVYGESKLTNEYQAMRFQQETKIDTIVVRLANVYGPRETNPHVIPEIMTQIVEGKRNISLGNIDPKRDFIYTSDVAQAFVSLALCSTEPGSHIVNLGYGKEYSIRDILAKLSNILGQEISYKKDISRYRTTERMHLVADVTRIHNLVGWIPKVTLDQGLQDLCKWYNLL